jgi:hypothetical protein
MPNTLLTSTQKKKILSAIGNKDFRQIISLLDSVKTSHAGTAKTKDKRFVITSLVKDVFDSTKDLKDCEFQRGKIFFNYGNIFYKMDESVSKQIAVSLIWRAYAYNKRIVKEILLDVADNDNWEVRETAGGILANILYYNPEFYSTLKKWAKHPSYKIRRAVVISSLGLLEKGKKENLPKVFELLEPLLYDDNIYVKRNLGPFVLGSYFGNNFPEEVFIQLDKWLKLKDENVRWNIAMAFRSSFGCRHRKKASAYLEILSKDNSPIVQRAVKSVMNFLKKHCRGSVIPRSKDRGY